MLKQRADYFNSTQGREVQRELINMSTNTKYNTTSTYTTNGELYPDNLIPFVDKHMNYINSHPQLDAWTYLANVKIYTRLI